MLLDEAPRRARRISLTPMIDVVFLLLVFFMLAARFGVEGVLPVTPAGGGGSWSGPPRLVDVRPDGVTLNGAPIAPEALADALDRLSEAPTDPGVLREFGRLVAAAASPIDDVRGTADYRRHALSVLAARCLGWAWSERPLEQAA